MKTLTFTFPKEAAALNAGERLLVPFPKKLAKKRRVRFAIPAADGRVFKVDILTNYIRLERIK